MDKFFNASQLASESSFVGYIKGYGSDSFSVRFLEESPFSDNIQTYGREFGIWKNGEYHADITEYVTQNFRKPVVVTYSNGCVLIADALSDKRVIKHIVSKVGDHLAEDSEGKQFQLVDDNKGICIPGSYQHALSVYYGLTDNTMIMYTYKGVPIWFEIESTHMSMDCVVSLMEDLVQEGKCTTDQIYNLLRETF